MTWDKRKRIKENGEQFRRIKVGGTSVPKKSAVFFAVETAPTKVG